MSTRLLHRYILLEFLAPFIVGVLVFTFVLVLNNLFLMMDLFLNRGIGLQWILALVGLVVPIFLPISLPMSCLLGATLVMGRMSEDHELVALRACGCSIYQLSSSVLLFSLFLSFGLVYFNQSVAPRAAYQFKELYQSLARQNPLALFSERTMNQFGEYKILVNSLDRAKMEMSGVSIYKVNSEGPPTRILAPVGKMEPRPDGLIFRLSDGAIHQPNSDKPQEYTITKFNRFALRIPSQNDIPLPPPSVKEMTRTQILSQMQSSQDSGRLNREKAELGSRSAIAFAPLIFACLGIGIGVQIRRQARAIGGILSLLIILFYYGLQIFSRSMTDSGILTITFWCWLPNITLSLMALLVWKRLVRE